MTVSEYRKKLSAAFNKARAGEAVLIRRGNDVFSLVRVGSDADLTLMTPRLQERIQEAERECKAGRCVTCSSREELGAFLDSL